MDDLLTQAVRRFLNEREWIEKQTIKGLLAIRRGEVLDHREKQADFDNWAR